MPRNITVYFSDGSAHQYNNAPDVLTPNDVEARTKRDYPNKKIVKIDGGKSTVSNQPSEKQPAGLSQFNIKGLRFGMDLNQVLAITKATVNDFQAYSAANLAYTKNQGYMPGSGLNMPNPTQYQKPAETWNDSLRGFTIGGQRLFWNADVENDRLVKISASTRSERIDQLLVNFESYYGKPKLHQFKSRTRGGIELDDYTATWKIQDAVIEMNRHINRDNGYVSISSASYADQEAAKYKSQDAAAKKDF